MSSSSIAVKSKCDMVTTRDPVKVHPNVHSKQRTPSSEWGDTVDFEEMASYFLGFWEAPHVVQAMATLEKYEPKRLLKSFRKTYGEWCPPPEVLQVLLKPRPSYPSRLPDTKGCRKLKFVLKMLGCSLLEHRPYSEFLRAKSIRQKRLWMYRYMPMQHDQKQVSHYKEPICPTRLRRLYHFFPDRFKEENNAIFFNDHAITYDDKKNIYFFETFPRNDKESH